MVFQINIHVYGKFIGFVLLCELHFNCKSNMEYQRMELGGQGGSLITIHKEKKHLFTFHVENKLNSHFTWN